MLSMHTFILFFFFNDTATTEIYTLSLHDALPISLPIAPPPDSVGGMGAAASPPEQSLGSAPQQSLGSAPQLTAEVGGAKAVQRERDASVDSAAGPAPAKRTGTEPPLGKANRAPAIAA